MTERRIWRRRGFGRWAAGVLTLGLALGPAPALPAPPRRRAGPTSDTDRAIVAYQALQRYFARPGGRYRERYPDSGETTATLWPFSQALEATILLAGLPVVGERFEASLRDQLAGLELYWSAAAPRATSGGASPPAGYLSTAVGSGARPGDLYYDDNAWVGLALVACYSLTADPALLRRAEQIFQLLVSGWDDDPTHPYPGGVFWARRTDNRDRNTVSTASAALLGAELFLLTRQASYLEWARRMDQWVERTLRAPNGLYADHLDLAGQIDPTQWSYNQGLMVGATLRLSEAIGRPDDLARAEEIARRALEAGRPSFRRQPVVFNAIFFRYLLRLDARRPDPAYRAALRQYAEDLWRAVDESTGLLRQQITEPTTLLDQAALVQLFALLAGHAVPNPAPG